MTDGDPLKKSKQLRRAVERVADELGMDLQGFLIDPSSPAKVQAMFKIRPEAVETVEDKEQKDVDDTFEQLMGKEFSMSSEPEDKPDMGDWFKP